MKTKLSGTLNVPASGIPAVGEPVNALTEQVNNLQRRYYRSLAPGCELRGSSDRWYLGAILEKNSSKVCGLKKNAHLCSDFHLNQATRFANRLPLAFFMPIGYLYSSVPCGALMRPLPDSGGSQRGAELFLFPLRNNQSIVSF